VREEERKGERKGKMKRERMYRKDTKSRHLDPYALDLPSTVFMLFFYIFSVSFAHLPSLS
jgi:hypothetical protein